MGYTNMLVVIAMAALAGIMTAGMGVNTKEADAVVSDYYQGKIARETAMSGLNLAINKLKTLEDWSNTDNLNIPETSYGDGAYLATFSDYTALESEEGETVNVTIRGYNGASEHVVKAKVGKKHGLELSETFSDHVVVGPDVIIQGNPGFFSYEMTRNTNVHANDDLITSTEEIISGYGTYNGTFSGDEDIFRPVTNDQGNSPVYSDNEVDLDYFTTNVLWALQERAHYSSPGDVTWQGDVTIDLSSYEGVTGAGTKDNPYILFISGDLTIDGTVTLLGYGTIVTQHGINILSGSTILPSNSMPPLLGTQDQMQAWIASHLPEGAPLALLACGDIIVEDDVTVVGQLYALYEAELTDPDPGELVCPDINYDAALDSYIDPTNPKKRIICHFPPGNPANVRTISISQNAVQTHYDHHDDYAGPCVNLDDCEYVGGKTTVIGGVIAQETSTTFDGSIVVWHTPPTETVLPDEWLISSDEKDGGVETLEISEWSTGHMDAEDRALIAANDLQGSVDDPNNPGHVLICHYPPGGQTTPHTVSVPENQVHTFFGYPNDYDGACN